MKYRNRNNIVQLVLNEVRKARIFKVLFADFRSVRRGGVFHVTDLISNVNFSIF